ncbi:vWA domain-containing protein [Paenibacillus sp. CAU 1782]
MQFLSASSALFALACSAIIVMYILKKQYQNTKVPSHLLWRRVLQEQEANSPWQKLRGRLLLFMQLLAALLLVLALMEPVITRSITQSGHAVMLIDRSGSMTAKAAAGGNGLEPDVQGQSGSSDTKLDAALRAAEQWLDEQPPKRQVSIVVNGSQPEVLASRETDHDMVKDILRSISPTYGYSDNTAALSLADSIHQYGDDGITVIFTDGNWHDFADSNALPLQTRSIVSMIEGEPGNVGILSFGMKEDVSRPGYNQAVITVRNDGVTTKNFTVNLYAYEKDGAREQVALLEISAESGEWNSGEARGLPPADYYKAELKTSDAWVGDNFAYAFPAVQTTPKVLLVTEGNLFLEKALLLAGVQPVRMLPETEPPSGAQGEEIGWILLDGTLDKVEDNAAWQKLLADKPLWIIDRPGSSGSEIAQPAGTGVDILEHEVTAYLSFQDTHISRFAKPDAGEVDWGRPVLTYGGIPAIYAGNHNGKPQLRFTFRLQDSDLPLRPEFPVLIMQAAGWMNGGQGHLGYATAGQGIELSLHPETATAYWIPVEPWETGFAADDEALRRPRQLLGLGAGVYEAPAIPGLYKLAEEDNSGLLLQERFLALSASREELSPLQEGKLELKLAVPNDGQESVQEQTGTDEPMTNLPLTAAVMGLLLLLLVAEWEVYRRGHTG